MKNRLSLLSAMGALGIFVVGCVATKPPRSWDFRVVERVDSPPHTGFYERVLSEQAVDGWEVISAQIQDNPIEGRNERRITVVLQRPKR